MSVRRDATMCSIDSCTVYRVLDVVTTVIGVIHCEIDAIYSAVTFCLFGDRNIAYAFFYLSFSSGDTYTSGFQNIVILFLHSFIFFEPSFHYSLYDFLRL